MITASSFLGGASFISLFVLPPQNNSHIEEWLNAFHMIAFYLFLSTILFIVGAGHIKVTADAKFAFAAAKFTFATAMLCFGTAFYLQGAAYTYRARDYGAAFDLLARLCHIRAGLWIGGGIGAAIAFFAFVSVHPLRSCC